MASIGLGHNIFLNMSALIAPSADNTFVIATMKDDLPHSWPCNKEEAASMIKAATVAPTMGSVEKWASSPDLCLANSWESDQPLLPLRLTKQGPWDTYQMMIGE